MRAPGRRLRECWGRSHERRRRARLRRKRSPGPCSRRLWACRRPPCGCSPAGLRLTNGPLAELSQGFDYYPDVMADPNLGGQLASLRMARALRVVVRDPRCDKLLDRLEAADEAPWPQFAAALLDLRASTRRSKRGPAGRAATTGKDTPPHERTRTPPAAVFRNNAAGRRACGNANIRRDLAPNRGGVGR